MSANRRTFLKVLGFSATGLGLVTSGCRTSSPPHANTGLPRSTPEAEGVSSSAILDFLDAIGRSKHELHSFMFARHGRVIAEGWWAPYAPELNHTMYSMSKSFTSTAVGFAVTENRLRVEDRVVSFFPKELPAQVDQNLAALRVKDLLTMSAGHGKEPTQDMVKQEDWVKAFLAAPITHPPGSMFMYNSAATYMLSAVVQQVTGQKVIDYLQSRLFARLGIEGETWETCPRGINVGGWGLSIRTEGMAKFGQLYLQKGAWNGRQILPAKWVEEATSFKIQQPAPAHPTHPKEENDWLQGYCYQFWRSRHNAFRGDGAFGQFTLAMPDQGAVIAMTSETSDMQGELDLVWKHLFPAMNAGALKPDPDSLEKLRQKLSGLRLDPPKGQALPPLAGRVSEKPFTLEANELGFSSATFAFQGDGCVVTLRDAAGEYPIVCGIESWRKGETALPGTPPRLASGGAPPPGTKFKVAASGRWKNEHTFEATLRFYETPHHDTLTCGFDGDELTIAFMSSIAALSPTPKDKRPVLRGRRQT